MSLVFGGSGELSAAVVLSDAQAVEARGQYTLAPDGTATIVLMVDEGGTTSVYAGAVRGDAAEGRVTVAGRNLGKFTAAR